VLLEDVTFINSHGVFVVHRHLTDAIQEQRIARAITAFSVLQEMESSAQESGVDYQSEPEVRRTVDWIAISHLPS